MVQVVLVGKTDHHDVTLFCILKIEERVATVPDTVQRHYPTSESTEITRYANLKSSNEIRRQNLAKKSPARKVSQLIHRRVATRSIGLSPVKLSKSSKRKATQSPPTLPALKNADKIQRLEKEKSQQYEPCNKKVRGIACLGNKHDKKHVCGVKASKDEIYKRCEMSNISQPLAHMIMKDNTVNNVLTLRFDKMKNKYR